MWGALNVLDAEGPITQHALGKAIGMDPSSMVSTIDELESTGPGRATPAPERPPRATRCTSPTHGHETLARGRELAREAQDELLAPLTAEEREQLRELLLKLAVASQAVQRLPGLNRARAAPRARSRSPAASM